MVDGWELRWIWLYFNITWELGLFIKVVIQDAKIWSTKIANRSQTVSSLLSLIDPFDILAKHGELTLALHPMKIPDGYQIAGLEELGLWSTSQSSLWIWSLRQKIGVNFHCLYSEVIFFLLKRYVKSIVFWYYPYLWLYVRFDSLGSHIVCI